MEAQLDEKRVSPLELFFDLVFVFAFTQVTSLMSDKPTWTGLGEGVLVLAALWFCWAAYAWLTSAIDPDEGPARVVMFGCMAAMLLAALGVPGAFGDDGVLFGAAYLVVRVLHVVLYAEVTDDVDARDAIVRLAPTAILGPALILAAGFLDGTAQVLLWILALTIDYAGPYVTGVEGFRIFPGHFAERFGLIVIIALGESIVAVGVGASGIELDLPVLAAAVLGMAVAAALWWTYFDVVAVVASRKLESIDDRHERNKMARDSYSYLHLPMIAGIVLVALGMKKTLGDVDEPLETVPAVALCGGVALYLLAHVAFRLRNVRTWAKRRVVVAAAALVLIPAATALDALPALALVAGLLVALTTYEVIRFREPRARLRASLHGSSA